MSATHHEAEAIVDTQRFADLLNEKIWQPIEVEGGGRSRRRRHRRRRRATGLLHIAHAHRRAHDLRSRSSRLDLLSY